MSSQDAFVHGNTHVPHSDLESRRFGVQFLSELSTLGVT